MAIYHCDIKCVSRKTGNISASVAYRIGESIESAEDGKLRHANRNAKDVTHKEVMNWDGTAQDLCNAIENSEKRVDAKLGREIMVALPKELNDEQRIQLTRDFTEKMIEKFGFAAIVALHRPGFKRDENGRRTKETNGNHHAHIMTTTRVVEDKNTLGAKIRQLDSPKTSRDEIKFIRDLWADTVNTHLERIGVQERISSSASADELKNVHHSHKSELCAKNDEISLRKQERDAIANELCDKIINRAMRDDYGIKDSRKDETQNSIIRRNENTVGSDKYDGGVGLFRRAFNSFGSALGKSFKGLSPEGQKSGNGYVDPATGEVAPSSRSLRPLVHPLPPTRTDAEPRTSRTLRTEVRSPGGSARFAASCVSRTPRVESECVGKPTAPNTQEWARLRRRLG